MTILFIFSVIAVVYHLIWENLIAPTIRMQLRFKLFALRDNVRDFQYAAKTDSLKAASMDLEILINNAIRLLHTATISSLLAAQKELENNPALSKKIEKRKASVESVPELKEISSRVTNLVASGFVANSGGWFLYLIPMLIIFLSFSALKNLLEELLTVKSNEILAIDPQFACAT